MPAFTGTVHYFERDDPNLGKVGWQATVEVRFAGPMEYEVEIIEDNRWNTTLDVLQPLTGPGTLYTADGSSLWMKDPNADGPVFYADVDLWRHLFYDSAPPGPQWPDVCGSDPEILGTEEILGRVTKHVACTTHELWVDEGSGLVLRMSGPLGNLDHADYYAPVAGQLGGFTFTQLEFGAVPAQQSSVPAGDSLRADVSWSQAAGFIFEGPSEIGPLDLPVPFEVRFERESAAAAAIAIIEVARGWSFDEFVDYATEAELRFADLSTAPLPSWVVYAKAAAVPTGENRLTLRIPFLVDGMVHILGSQDAGLDVGIGSPQAGLIAVVEAHIGRLASEGSYAGVSCGFAPEDLPGRTPRVTRSPRLDGFEYSYEGPAVLDPGEAVFVHRISRSAQIALEGSSYAALVGLAEGYTWDDFVLLAEEQNLNLRGLGGLIYDSSWPRPDWVVFDAALETGCEGSFVTGTAVDLVVGQYYLAADMSPGIYEISANQVVATLEVTP